MRAVLIFLGAASLALASTVATAHHSFDGTFDRNKLVKITGKVAEFRFINPHALILVTARDADGKDQQWIVETSSTEDLGRRGWTFESVRPGETLVIEGWAAKSGKAYMRLRVADRADGTPIGAPFTL